jgi:hypothetical protein
MHQVGYLPRISAVYTDNKTLNSVQAYCRPKGFQEVEDPRFQDIRHIKVVKLTALRFGPRAIM